MTVLQACEIASDDILKGMTVLQAYEIASDDRP